MATGVGIRNWFVAALAGLGFPATAAVAMPTFHLLQVNVIGSGTQPISVQPPGPYFRHQQGDNYPPDSASLGMFPSLEFHSYIAMSTEPTNSIFTADPPDGSFPGGFDQTNGHFAAPGQLQGGWQTSNPGVQSVMNPLSGLQAVFVARLTVPDGSVPASDGVEVGIAGEDSQVLELLIEPAAAQSSVRRVVRGGRVFKLSAYQTANDQMLSPVTLVERGAPPVLWDTFDVFVEEVPPGCPGDANADGAVDIDDLNMVLGNFGSGGPAGDLNNDGIVDIGDLNLVIGNFGTSCV